MSDDFFAPPPFRPEEALLKLKKELRDLGLAEREGRFERRGQALVRAALEGSGLRVARVREPARSPQWIESVVKDAAGLREFVSVLKRELARWGDRDE